MASPAPRVGSARAKLIVNVILVASYIAISAPQATRIPVHEWLSLAFVGVLAVHLLFSWSWIVEVVRRFLSPLRARVRFNGVLDATSYLAMVVVMISGIVISEAALPAMGLPRPRDRFWSIIHNQSSKLLLVLIGMHLAMHWDWVLTALKRLRAGALPGGSSQPGGARRWLLPVGTLALVSVVAAAGTVAVGRLPAADALRQTGRRAKAVREQPPSRKARREAAAAGARQPRAGGAAKRLAPGTPPQLPWRDRLMRPARQIATYMGGAFVLTLAALGVAKRVRQDVATRGEDPLTQQVE